MKIAFAQPHAGCIAMDALWTSRNSFSCTNGVTRTPTSMKTRAHWTHLQQQLKRVIRGFSRDSCTRTSYTLISSSAEASFHWASLSLHVYKCQRVMTNVTFSY